MASTQQIRIGLIGLGRHLMRSLLPNILALPELTIVAGCDINDQRRAEYAVRFPGVTLFPSAEALLEQSSSLALDAVVISLDPTGHVTWTEAALARRLHVFVEKPAAFSSKELLAIAERADPQCVTMVGTMWRYTVGVQRFQSWQEQAPQREIRHMALNATFPAAFPRAGWDVPLMALPFYDMFLHGIDCAVALMGTPTSVRVYLTGDPTDPAVLDQPSAVTIVQRHATGALAVLTMHLGSHRYHVDFNLTLDDGSFVHMVDLTRLSVTTAPTWSGTEGSLRDHPSLDWEPGQMYRGYARHGYIEEFKVFADAIRAGTRTPSDLRVAAQSLAVLEACLQSLVEQTEIDVEQL